MRVNRTKAYHELMTRILDEENYEKFEWSVGAMLTGATSRPVVIVGPSGSGKTTLTSIIRSILTKYVSDFSPRVTFVHWNEPMNSATEDTYVFVESLHETDPTCLTIHTTGDRIPVNAYHVLMRQIETELDIVADLCITTYQTLGYAHYDNEIQENI